MKALLLALAIAGAEPLTEAVLLLSGAACVEELDASEMERYRTLHEHPLPLNGCSRSRLTSTGLLTRYQTASLEDYRRRNGDILSFAELALVDGFNAEIAEALKQFFTLEGTLEGGKWRRLEGSVSTKYSAGGAWGIKSRWTLDGKWEMSAGNKSWSAALYGKRHLGKLAAGDLNARFGQGLLMWNGFTLSGYSSISAFSRNACGVSTCSSYTSEGHLRGVAADLCFGNWTVTALGSFDGNTALGNVTRSGKTATFGATVLVKDVMETLQSRAAGNTGATATLGASADFRFSLPAVAIFGEAGYVSGEWRGIAGAIWTPVYKTSLAVKGVWADTRGIALGAQAGWVFASLDGSTKDGKFTGKSRLQLSPEIKLGELTLKPSLLWQERYRPYEENRWRSDLRADADASVGPWTLHLRANAVKCAGYAFAGYAEGGFKKDNFGCYLRGGLFRADDWEDRIYVYERDVPGNFNVPARYGRGWWTSLYTSLKFRALKCRHTLGLRLGATVYEKSSGKEPKLELKMQYSLNL